MVVLDTFVIKYLDNNVERVVAFLSILLPQVRTLDYYDSIFVSCNVITHIA